MASADPAPISFWFDGLPDPGPARSALEGREDTDVAIVGAGYSGLWTAYYLAGLRPELSIAVAEAEVAGFGASGRNGGWCTAALAGVEGLLARPERRAAGVALQRAAFDAVDEVGRVCEREGIDCHYRKGGSLRLATTAAQRDALVEDHRKLIEWGFGAADYQWLEPDACARRIRVPSTLGAVYTPHCAALHPARLVRGLAEAVERRGVRVFERSRVRELLPGRVRTVSGELRARTVVRATEAYTARLPGLARRLVPLHSLMIATEPLPGAVWKEIGLGERETFGDGRRIVVYGQRTADDRLAFGARGDYRFGSGIEDVYRPGDPRFDGIRRALVQLLPVLDGVRVTHRWGGALGVPRNWRPSLGLDRKSGLAWLGGYVGQGVAASNLAGRTLAELIAGERSERTALPWVDARSRSWEREPLRWLACTAIRRFGEAADRAEREGRGPGLRGAVFDGFVAK